MCPGSSFDPSAAEASSFGLGSPAVVVSVAGLSSCVTDNCWSMAALSRSLPCVTPVAAAYPCSADLLTAWLIIWIWPISSAGYTQYVRAMPWTIVSV